MKNNQKKGVLEKLGFKKNTEDTYKDFEFMQKISPKGGIKFNTGNEKYIATGTGYEACIYVYDYPTNISSNWMIDLTYHKNAITIWDIGSADTTEIKKNLNKSMSEQNSRFKTAKNSADRIDAEQRYNELRDMYKELSTMGDVMKKVLFRIYVAGRTLYELDNNVKEIIAKLESDTYGAAVCLNETKSDWRAAFLPLEKQEKDVYKKPTQPILSTQIALGNPFNFSTLDDEHGYHWGTTKTGGIVNLDSFKRTKKRMSYNSVFIGEMRSGKSTSLKKQMEDRAIRGDYVRVLDVNGEFNAETEYLGGRVIALDGESSDKINGLQIMRSGKNDKISYNQHLSKVSTIYQFMNPTADKQEIVRLRKLLKQLYREFNIITSDGTLVDNVTNLDPYKYPVWEDLLKQAHMEKKELKESAGESSEIERLNNIESIIEDMCDSYGNIFNHHTSIPDLYNEPVVTYNINGLKDIEGVYEAQFFNTLMLNYANGLEVGGRMKQLYEDKKIAWEDVTRFLLIGDEFHRVLTANKLFALDKILLMQREFPKYFGGISIATQSIRDMVPESASGRAVEEIKKIFELSTYKFILRQDTSAKKRIKEIFDGEFTDWEINQIPALETGQAILSIKGESNIFMNIEVTDQQNERFKGGV